MGWRRKGRRRGLIRRFGGGILGLRIGMVLLRAIEVGLGGDGW